MLVALAAAMAVAAPGLPGCDRPLPSGPRVPAPIVLHTPCGAFLLQRDGVVERLSARWVHEHGGRLPRRFGDDLQVRVGRRGTIVVRRGATRVWRSSDRHHGLTPAFGPRGALAFGAYGEGVFLTDLRSPERLVAPGRDVWPLAFGADGHLVVRGRKVLSVLRPDGSLRARVAYRPAHGNVVDHATGRVHVIAPDGTLTAVDGARITRVVRLAGARGWLAFAAHDRFAFHEGRRVRVWGRDGRVVAQAGWRRGLAADSGLSVRPDGRAAAFRLSDARPGAAFGTASIRVLDEASGRAREVYRHRLGPLGCAVGGNLSWHGGAVLYAAYDGHVAVLDADGDPPVRLGRLAQALSPPGGTDGVRAAWRSDYRSMVDSVDR